MANEKRLIDANEAYEIARGSGRHNDFARSRADLTSLEEVLEDCTTVDAVEVVHGRWVNAGGDLHYSGVLYFCSVCNKAHFVNARHALVTSHYHDEIFNKPKYCPHCGAKMDGGNEDG